ncbi:MAG TPA: hypothetical protein VIU12_02725 [Chryseolinea sp.]
MFNCGGAGLVAAGADCTGLSVFSFSTFLGADSTFLATGLGATAALGAGFSTLGAAFSTLSATGFSAFFSTTTFLGAAFFATTAFLAGALGAAFLATTFLAGAFLAFAATVFFALAAGLAFAGAFFAAFEVVFLFLAIMGFLRLVKDAQNYASMHENKNIDLINCRTGVLIKFPRLS